MQGLLDGQKDEDDRDGEENDGDDGTSRGAGGAGDGAGAREPVSASGGLGACAASDGKEVSRGGAQAEMLKGNTSSGTGSLHSATDGHSRSSPKTPRRAANNKAIAEHQLLTSGNDGEKDTPRGGAGLHEEEDDVVVHQPPNSHRLMRLGNLIRSPSVAASPYPGGDSMGTLRSTRRSYPASVRKRPHVSEHDLLIYAVTWNMHEQDIPHSLEALLFPQGRESTARCHVIAVATQEGTMARRNWELKLQETLGPNYVLVHSHPLMGIHLCLFLQRDLIWVTSSVESVHVATKMGGMLRTKGGVGIALRIKNASFLFVDSHLAAHSENVKQRDEDFHTISRNLVFTKFPSSPVASSGHGSGAGVGAGAASVAPLGGPAAVHLPPITSLSASLLPAPSFSASANNTWTSSVSAGYTTPKSGGLSSTKGPSGRLKGTGPSSSTLPAPAGTDVLQQFDFVIWMGDLNYRVDMKRSTVEKALQDEQWEVLLANDQLTKGRECGRVFQSFSEADIAFPPTFKYDIGSDDFDTSAKQRVPSWTDRILFRGPVLCEAYGCVRSLRISDHRPVYGVFIASLKHIPPRGPANPLDVATFDRDAYVECLRRAQQDASELGSMNSVAESDGRSTGTRGTVDDSEGGEPVSAIATPKPIPRHAHRATLRETVIYKSSVICTIC